MGKGIAESFRRGETLPCFGFGRAKRYLGERTKVQRYTRSALIR